MILSDPSEISPFNKSTAVANRTLIPGTADLSFEGFHRMIASGDRAKRHTAQVSTGSRPDASDRLAPIGKREAFALGKVSGRGRPVEAVEQHRLVGPRHESDSFADRELSIVGSARRISRKGQVILAEAIGIAGDQHAFASSGSDGGNRSLCAGGLAGAVRDRARP